MSVNFRGEKLVFDERLTAETKTQKVTFAAKQRIEGREAIVPYMAFEEKKIVDPGFASKPISSLKIRTTKSSEFIGAIKSDYRKHKAYIFPRYEALMGRLRSEDRSNSAYMQISGSRLSQYFKEVRDFLKSSSESSGMSRTERETCEREISYMSRSALREMTHHFDAANTNTYWSRSKDQVFVHVYEKLLLSLPAADPQRAILQEEIDYLLTYQYAGETGWVKEFDIEKSLGLLAIDKRSRHIVSMTEDTEDSMEAIKYETLKFPKNHFSDFKGQYVYRDGENYYLESTHEKIKPRLLPGIVRDEIVERVVLRRLTRSEKKLERHVLRDNFKFDWMEDGFIHPEKIDASWWGSCEKRAILQAKLADLKNCGGVVEYNADSDTTGTFKRSDLLEISASLLDFGKKMRGTRGGKAKSLGTYSDAGETFEARPEDLVFTVGSGRKTKKIALPCQIKRVNNSTELENFFSEKSVDSSNRSFVANDSVTVRADPRNVEDDDDKKLNYVEINQEIEASGSQPCGRIKGNFGYVVDCETGEVVPGKFKFKLNQSTSDLILGPQLIASELIDSDQLIFEQYFYGASSNELVKKRIQYEESGSRWLPVVLKEDVLGEVKSTCVGRERRRDDSAKEKFEMMEKAVSTGHHINCDSETKRPQLWNGDVKKLRMHTEYISADKKWERVAVYMDATFAESARVTADDGVSKFGKKGVYLCQYDDSGKLIDVLELEAVVDSFWDENPTIAAIASEGGRTVFNKAMVERGIIDTAGGLSGNIAALTTLKNLMSLLYMGYMSQNNKPIYSLYKDGERYMYSNKVEFEMAVAEAKAARLEEERRNIAVRHQKRGRAEHGPLEARRSRRVGV